MAVGAWSAGAAQAARRALPRRTAASPPVPRPYLRGCDSSAQGRALSPGAAVSLRRHVHAGHRAQPGPDTLAARATMGADVVTVPGEPGLASSGFRERSSSSSAPSWTPGSAHGHLPSGSLRRLGAGRRWPAGGSIRPAADRDGGVLLHGVHASSRSSPWSRAPSTGARWTSEHRCGMAARHVPLATVRAITTEQQVRTAPGPGRCSSVRPLVGAGITAARPMASRA